MVALTVVWLGGGGVAGFELRQGRHVPVIEGIVCREFEREVLLEAWAAAEGQRQEKADEKREARVAKAWAKMAKALVNRHRIFQQYGAGGGKQQQG